MALPTVMHDATQVNNSAVALPGLLAVFLIAYSLGAYCRWGPSLIGLASLTAGVNTTSSSGFNPLFEMVTVGPWLVGLVVSSRRRLATELEARASELEEEQEIFAVASVRYERARIARELHDIVAHCISLMVVQAGAGERLVAIGPGRSDQSVCLDRRRGQRSRSGDRPFGRVPRPVRRRQAPGRGCAS